MSFVFSVPVFSMNTMAESGKEIKDVTIFVVGDSTACEYGYDEAYAIPRAGWGMCLSNCLNDKAKVVDLALGGRSSKSFIAEENYQRLKNDLKQGDLLLIQFGHNDAKNKTEDDIRDRYTDPQGNKETEGSFKYYLYENYIKFAQEKGAVPILISPVSRRKFDENGKITDSHGYYDDAVRELAEETGVDFIDMTKITEELYNNAGDKLTKFFHAAYNDKSKATDNTHFNYLGASIMAELILSENDELSQYIDTDKTNNKYATRGEFIEALMRAIGETEKITEENFKDVSDKYAYANSIALAKKTGIASGDKNGNFNPDANLTGYDAAVFTMRALRYKNIDYKKSNLLENLNVPSYASQDVSDLFGIFEQYTNYLSERANSLLLDAITSVITADKVLFAFRDFFTVPVYEMILEKEKSEVIEQDLNDLEKVENTK